MSAVHETIEARERYEKLPLCVRLSITFEDWMWIPDRGKATLIQDATEPEIEL